MRWLVLMAHTAETRAISERYHYLEANFPEDMDSMLEVHHLRSCVMPRYFDWDEGHRAYADGVRVQLAMLVWRKGWVFGREAKRRWLGGLRDLFLAMMPAYKNSRYDVVPLDAVERRVGLVNHGRRWRPWQLRSYATPLEVMERAVGVLFRGACARPKWGQRRVAFPPTVEQWRRQQQR
jgi:hypothetical protein